MPKDNKSSPFASTSFGAPPSLSSDISVDSDDDFQPPINSVFDYVAPKDIFQDLKAIRFGCSWSTAPSYSTAVSTPAEDFNAILSAMSPKEVGEFFSTFQDPVPSLNLSKSASNSNTSAPAPKASGKTDTEDKKVSKKVQKKIDKREELEKAKEEAKDSSKSMKCPTCGGTDHARSSSKNCSECVIGSLLKYGIEDLYYKVLNNFYQLTQAVDIPIDVKTYAKKCYGYAANKSFKSEFIEVASTKKEIAEKAEVDHGASRLAKKGDCSLDENTSDSSQEKFPLDLSMDHHPLRTYEYTLFSNIGVAEEEEDNNEEENSDNIYNISKECYTFKHNTLRSQANPSTLSDIKILYVQAVSLSGKNQDEYWLPRLTALDINKVWNSRDSDPAIYLGYPL
ncbi:hypothetical protein [Parasitella parasitica]|uniref:Uncharacterized protein n=1 Tax=Parasitella parasitica TaxID=35722 RepID=A0A0B7NT75_9FUNG|nr:hypothetical protein [Parasitella parasitica]